MSEEANPAVDWQEALQRWAGELEATRAATQRCMAILERWEEGGELAGDRELRTLRSELAAVRHAVEQLAALVREPPAWIGPVEETARAAQAALERLGVLDATQAASLTSVGEELRALRMQLERGSHVSGGGEEVEAGESAYEFKGPRSQSGSRYGEPMLEIVRMHVELLRTLLERGWSSATERPGASGRSAEAGGSREVISEETSAGEQEDKAGTVSRLRTELRAVAAALEHQLSEVREEQQRRNQLLERRLEDIQHVLDHALSQDHGRRLFLIVALGLGFVFAVAFAGLLWHRTQSSVTGHVQAREEVGPPARGDAGKEAEYQRLLSEAGTAVARGEWDSAERALLQAIRLHPSAVEAQIALSVVQQKRADVTGQESALARSGRQVAAGPLNCSVRDGRLCCAIPPDPEQCISWPPLGGQATSTNVPTPTTRTRQRVQRTTAPEPASAGLEDDAF